MPIRPSPTGKLTSIPAKLRIACLTARLRKVEQAHIRYTPFSLSCRKTIMETLQVVLLALTQGLTEFLPISSSAHLILAPYLFGYADQGLAFDVAVHVGTLAAVIGYFRQQVAAILVDFFVCLAPRKPLTEHARMGWMIIIATLPVGLAGLAFKGLIENELRSPLVIAAATIGFGALLWLADLKGTRQRAESTIRWRDALIIGLFQALALIPGTSRSGSTITAGLMLGLTRQAASRFSFLLSIPTIFLSGALVSLELLQSANPVLWGDLAAGVTLSFITAYLCIHFFLRFIDRIGMLPFVLYRFALGIFIFLLVF
jgi:undecaprenyl-diphosphatase